MSSSLVTVKCRPVVFIAFISPVRIRCRKNSLILQATGLTSFARCYEFLDESPWGEFIQEADEFNLDWLPIKPQKFLLDIIAIFPTWQLFFLHLTRIGIQSNSQKNDHIILSRSKIARSQF